MKRESDINKHDKMPDLKMSKVKFILFNKYEKEMLHDMSYTKCLQEKCVSNRDEVATGGWRKLEERSDKTPPSGMIMILCLERL